MHDIIRDGAVHSQSAPENDGSIHCCAYEQVQAMKKDLCNCKEDWSNECIDCVITQVIHMILSFFGCLIRFIYEFSEVDCISSSDDLLNSNVNLKMKLGSWATTFHVSFCP
jgi:hypothetical protein